MLCSIILMFLHKSIFYTLIKFCSISLIIFLLYIYDLNVNSYEFGKYPANNTQTIEDQKQQGRRPHVSLQKLFVEDKQLEPDIIFDIRRCKIIQDNR